MRSLLPYMSGLSIVRDRFFTLGLVLIASCGLVPQQPSSPTASGRTTLNLWPHGVPGAKPGAPQESDISKADDYLVAGKPIIRFGNVSNPTITLYEAKSNPSGTAVVVFPGGGYNILAYDLEGTEVCEWLNSINITCVLLKYRVPDTGPYPKSAAALQDAQRALRMVRARAAEWHIDPHRIGVLGFSAGGHLVGALSTHFQRRLYDRVDSADEQSCRPDFAVLVYPAYLSDGEGSLAMTPDINVTGQTPPAFIVQAEDDTSYINSSLAYFAALKNAKVPAELHLYAEGGHGHGLRRTDKPVTRWPDLVESWLGTIGMVKTH
jgi:acetyl esterase/lipase